VAAKCSLISSYVPIMMAHAGATLAMRGTSPAGEERVRRIKSEPPPLSWTDEPIKRPRTPWSRTICRISSAVVGTKTGGAPSAAEKT
jgi:hypothetical protein